MQHKMSPSSLPPISSNYPGNLVCKAVGAERANGGPALTVDHDYDPSIMGPIPAP